MKTLLLLRHAKSSWKETKLTDFQRPLNKRGKRDAPRMGTLLKRDDLVPDLILTSSAARALATAELVAMACDYEEVIQYSRSLYHAAPESFIELINEVPDDCQRLLVVGHNPGIEELVEELTGYWERMPTAALAQIELPIDRWTELSLEVQGALIDAWQPKELD